MDHLPLHFPGHEKEGELEMEHPEPKATPMWDASVIGVGFICYATTLNPSLILKMFGIAGKMHSVVECLGSSPISALEPASY